MNFTLSQFLVVCLILSVLLYWVQPIMSLFIIPIFFIYQDKELKYFWFYFGYAFLWIFLVVLFLPSFARGTNNPRLLGFTIAIIFGFGISTSIQLILGFRRKSEFGIKFFICLFFLLCISPYFIILEKESFKSYSTYFTPRTKTQILMLEVALKFYQTQNG